MNPLPKERYRHYKGNTYEVIEIGAHTETGELLVIYKSLTDEKVWVRPLTMFFETVNMNGKEIPRFARIEK